MKIALLNTMTPFVRGGAEILVDDLQYELRKRGHHVVLFKIPFPYDYTLPLMNTMLAIKSMNLGDYDQVICFKFPSFVVKHKKKTLWMFHQFRQVYELYDHEYGMSSDGIGAAIKEVITSNDFNEIGEAHSVFTNASEVSNRLKKYNGLNSTVLTPPLKNWELYHNLEYGDYIYYPSRVTDIKRQHLAVEAMRYVKSDVKLIIDGVCGGEDYENNIMDTIKRYKLENKIERNNRWVTDDEKIEKMGKSLACLYLAYKEDSCGFTSMEAFYSAKPVISFTDSGGTYELIEHNRTGIFTEPNAINLAKAMDELYLDRKNTEKMGKGARDEIIKRDITWDETIRRLLL